MYLHQRKPTPKLISGSIIPPTTTTGMSGSSPMGGGGQGGAGAVGAIAGVAAMGVDAMVGDKNTRYGLSYKPVGAVAAKSALKGAATGASIGSVIPGIGTAVGAVVGGVIGGVTGFIKGKKDKEKIEKQVKQLDVANAKATDMQSEQFYNNLPTMQNVGYGKKGMMIPGYKMGVPAYEKGAVILAGQRHKEEGELGNGNPGIDAETGEKVVEVEAKEMLLSSEQSDKIHNLIEQYYQSQNEDVLFDLGSVARSIVLNAKKQK